MKQQHRLSLDLDASANVTIGDLTSLQVCVAELRLAPDRTWLYVLQLSCGRTRWQVVKRYSEIREFWVQLCEQLETGGLDCSERGHFLAGFEEDKFPKKRILHTRAVLESRANELEVFFRKLVMRLNLCSSIELDKCHMHGCSLLALISTFFEFATRWVRRNPYHRMTRYQSMALLKNQTKDGKQTNDGRLSLAALEDVSIA
ncbi:TPA: hypothetical protein N0F65_002539 [Lagenidium giganteum]|uniref:PX domain-containing protein n=1 Tax=Lagenidium giganteum TaxID=4803 RepID=A0AAV2YRS1_9STRA|nr:TPA: hypothetical protein N0F65_002539 [Lagenidium giganteum]